MLSIRCLSVCPVLSVCDVRALWPNGWTDQDETWHAGRPRPWPDCVRWGPCSPPPKGHSPRPQIFGPCLLQPNGRMDEAGTWHGGRPQPRRLCVRWGPSPLPQKGAEPSPQFSAHFYCGQTARCIKMTLGMDVGLSQGDFVLDEDPVFPPQQNFRPNSIVPNGWMHQDTTRYGGRPQPRRVC